MSICGTARHLAAGIRPLGFSLGAGIGKSALYEKKFTSKDYKKTGLVFRV